MRSRLLKNVRCKNGCALPCKHWKSRFIMWLLKRSPQYWNQIKALLGMLARLPWGRRDVLGSMNGKYEGVSVKYASLIVSCHRIKVFITA